LTTAYVPNKNEAQRQKSLKRSSVQRTVCWIRTADTEPARFSHWARNIFYNKQALLAPWPETTQRLYTASSFSTICPTQPGGPFVATLA
jgi:hypothetical protein